MFFSLYLWITSDLWLRLEWFPSIPFLNKKHWIENKQEIKRIHACFDSRIEITDQAHPTPPLNVLVLKGCRLVTAIQKPKENWTSELWVHKISFTIQNWTNTRTVFCCLLRTFVMHKIEYDPTFYVMINWKHRMDNEKLLVWIHACFYSQSEITNQAHSTPSFNVLETGGWRLGTEIQKPKKFWSQQNMSAQYLLHNEKQRKHKNRFALPVSNLFSIYICG